jgi:hypothetical protein
MHKRAALNWTTYNAKMADLFVERDKYPVDSPERAAVAERILGLWVHTTT